MNIGNSVKIGLVKRGMKNKELATAMGVSASYVSALANSVKNPSLNTVIRLAIALQYPVSEFIALGEEKAA